MAALGPALQPELWVDDTAAAVAFYERAFGAAVQHRAGDPDDSDGVVQLSIGGAHFWVSGASEAMRRFSARSLGGGTARFLLVVDDPRAVSEAAVSEAAVAAGAQETTGGVRLRRTDEQAHGLRRRVSC